MTDHRDVQRLWESRGRDRTECTSPGRSLPLRSFRVAPSLSCAISVPVRIFVFVIHVHRPCATCPSMRASAHGCVRSCKRARARERVSLCLISLNHTVSALTANSVAGRFFFFTELVESALFERSSLWRKPWRKEEQKKWGERRGPERRPAISWIAEVTKRCPSEWNKMIVWSGRIPVAVRVELRLQRGGCMHFNDFWSWLARFTLKHLRRYHCSWFACF